MGSSVSQPHQGHDSQSAGATSTLDPVSNADGDAFSMCVSDNPNVERIDTGSSVVARPHVAISTDDSAAGRFMPGKVIMALPAYNEEAALPELLERIGEAFADSGIPYEVIVVDDGSSDATLKIAKDMSFQMPIVVLKHKENRGLGETLRDGLLEAIDRAGERDIIVTMDADNTHPPGLIERMVKLIREGCDVVIASRFQPGACVIGVPLNRHFLSIGARILFTVMYRTQNVRDYTSGFRAYRASVIREAFASHGESFVSEKGFSCMADVDRKSVV